MKSKISSELNAFPHPIKSYVPTTFVFVGSGFGLDVVAPYVTYLIAGVGVPPLLSKVTV